MWGLLLLAGCREGEIEALADLIVGVAIVMLLGAMCGGVWLLALLIAPLWAWLSPQPLPRALAGGLGVTGVAAGGLVMLFGVSTFATPPVAGAPVDEGMLWFNLVSMLLSGFGIFALGAVGVLAAALKLPGQARRAAGGDAS
jgi:hypothetical protein